MSNETKTYGHLSDTLDTCCAPSQPKIVRDLALELKAALNQIENLEARHASALADKEGLIGRLQARVQELTPPDPVDLLQQAKDALDAAVSEAEATHEEKVKALQEALDVGEVSPVVEDFSLEQVLARARASTES